MNLVIIPQCSDSDDHIRMDRCLMSKTPQLKKDWGAPKLTWEKDVTGNHFGKTIFSNLRVGKYLKFSFVTIGIKNGLVVHTKM